MGKAEFGMAAGIAVVSCTVAVTVVRRRLNHRRKWNRVVEILRGFEEACGTPVTRLRTVVDAMAVEMFAGLATEGGSRLKMLLTFVDRPPNGSEKGTYYALDLGGTNFRVLRVQLGGRRSGILRCDIERHPISEPLLLGTSKDLFESIASSLKNFVEKEEEGSAPCAQRELGFSFSFPVKQMSVSSGTLIKWTKGFSVEDMIGKDVAKCLQEAITESGLDMHVAVLVNDSVGTLALGRYYDDDTVVAVVIDTETHACYVERAGAIVKFHGLPKTTKQMVINMEWANFWSGHLPRTSYDIELAAQSPYPHEQGFDKMISGMYLGDIVRRVLLRISQETDIFGAVSSKLSTPFILTMPLMVTMHEDETPDLRDVARVLNEVLEINYAPLKVRKLVVNICDIVTHRAGRLVAAGIVGILKKIGRDGSGENSSRRKGERIMRTVVAVEGAVYSKYRMFREYMEEGVAEILGEDVAPYVVLKEVEDGSGVGAALLAASQYSRI